MSGSREDIQGGARIGKGGAFSVAAPSAGLVWKFKEKKVVLR